MRPAAFLDKDGTLIENVPFHSEPRDIPFLPGVVEGLQMLQLYGYALIVVSNQARVAQGLINEQTLGLMAEDLVQRLKQHGIVLTGIYWCPHHPDGKLKSYAIECNCRKPAAGMILKAAAECDIDLSRSWMIGDILHDVEAGNRAGCRTILINNGNETEWDLGEQRFPNFVVNDFRAAASTIIAREPTQQRPLTQPTTSQKFHARPN